MSTKFLDYAGLSYFWSKLKAYFAKKASTLSGYGITDAKIQNGTITLGSDTITPLTSVPSHNQASNTITAMTDYSKPNSTSAISTSDTLNQAIGKLEKAIDDADISNVVHTSGDESIAGAKTFSANVTIENTWPAIYLKDTNVDRTVTPSAEDYNDLIWFYDKNDKLMYRLRGGFGTDDSTRMYMIVYKKGSTDTTAILGVAFDGSGNSYGYCPNPPAGSTDNRIATCNWTNTKLSDYVTTNTAQTISSTKTFTYDPWIVNEYPELKMKLEGTKRSVAPSSDMYYSLVNVYDDAGTSKRFFLLRGFYGTDRTSSMYLAVFKGTNNTENSGDSATMGVGFDTSGDSYAWCPTPDSSSNTNHIATTAWVVAKGYLTSHQSLANCMKVNATNEVKVFHMAHRNVNDSGICISGGNSTAVGAYLELYGPSYSSMAGRGRIIAKNSTTSKVFYVDPSGTAAWNGQTIQTSSDERLKTPIEDVSSDVLDVWENIQWGQFKFLEAVDEKGDGARFHVGLVAQAVDRVFKAHGSNVLGYGILCHDMQEATDERLDENGEVVEEAHEASDFWGVRYTEALCMEAAYMRRENARLKKRVADLEDRLAVLEGRLSALEARYPE